MVASLHGARTPLGSIHSYGPMFDPDLLSSIKRTTDNIPEVLGLLVFGSHAALSADEHSDVDVLVVTASEALIRETRRCGRYELDLDVLPHQVLAAQLDQRKWKDNVPLLALQSGIIVDDPTGLLQKLKLEAESLWNEGTGKLTKRDCTLLLSGISKSVGASKKLTQRLVHSTDKYKSSLMILELAAIHVALSVLYLRSNRCWVYAPWVVAKLEKPCYRELAEMNRSILEVDDPVIKVRLLESLANKASVEIERCLSSAIA